VRVVVVPGDDIVLICVWLLGDTIINDDVPISAFRAFDRSHMRFDVDDLPQVCGGKLLLREEAEEALDTIMADPSIQQGRQTRACGLTERAYQIIAVHIQQFFVRHTLNLPYITSTIHHISLAA
jgi:hypothetical protein